MVEGEAANGFHKAEFLPSEDSKADNSIRGDSLTLGIKRIQR